MLLIAVIHSYNLLGTLFSFNHKKPKGMMSVILYFAIMTCVFFFNYFFFNIRTENVCLF